MVVKILIPYNFKPNDEKAVHYTGQRYRREKEVEITLFHAFASVPEINVKNNTIMEKMKLNIYYLRQQREERRQAMEKVRGVLVDYGFASQNVHCLFQPIKTDIAADIIQLWKLENFNVVVLNRNPGNILNYFSRSISKRLTQCSDGVINVHIVN
ncbi:MAG: hypothetical protein PF690_14620 [Deltaproteobacteria bacterium]|jgi:hypothetical protein|nr:hypothetical protein [Deltaproteobacteria bacterium]